MTSSSLHQPSAKPIRYISDANTDDFATGSSVTIGNFDGVHLGHQALLERTCASRAHYNKPTHKAVVLTFDPHPSQYFVELNRAKVNSSSQSAAPRSLIESIDRRLNRLRSYASSSSPSEALSQSSSRPIDAVFTIRFNEMMANTSADDFISMYLKDKLNMKHLVIGYDFCFGKGREGTTDFLVDRQQRFDYTLEVVPAKHILQSPPQMRSPHLPQHSPQYSPNMIISSSAIRTAIKAGQFEMVTAMLGRHYDIQGAVGSGAGRGTELGFPTANVDFKHGILPKNGVYIGQLFVSHETLTKDHPIARDAMHARTTPTPYPALISVGTAPTFSRGGEPILEVYVIDETLDLRHKTVIVTFIKFLREEIAFESTNALIAEMQRDKQRAIVFFSQRQKGIRSSQ